MGSGAPTDQPQHHAQIITDQLLHIPPAAGKPTVQAARAEAEHHMACATNERAGHHGNVGRIKSGAGSHCFRQLLNVLTGFDANELGRFAALHMYGARLRQKFTLEDAIAFHAFAPLEAMSCV
jgi:hypothetical protein